MTNHFIMHIVMNALITGVSLIIWVDARNYTVMLLNCWIAEA